ncbi:hypothetical protein X801_05297 [Opisthorchis viverrini]|uniref:WW domain-containing protein n=1 Tax=Opisthorchis viverrini TaxID=6198 RepID=A0A1S8WWR8_OPIVI|nr:hypothetical protein X801_05297 [Opisthorchis viverrini]
MDAPDGRYSSGEFISVLFSVLFMSRVCLFISSFDSVLFLVIRFLFSSIHKELCPWQMSTVRMSNGLHSQLEEFLSEVDSINPFTNDHAVETAPGCEWVVRLDPITKSSTYHHIRSGEISSVMPEEYKRYLSTFDAFLGGSDDEAVNSQQTNSGGGPTLSSPRTRQNSTKKNESSEQPTSGLDGLSGIIGYGDSSDTDSDRESKSRSVKVTEIHETTHTPDQPSGFSLSASSPVNHLPDSTSQDQSFIGPTLPPNRLSATERSPSPTWACQNQQHRPKKSALEASARTLLDQFTALEFNSDSLDALRTRYIQLMTRFEDWLCGKLSSNYFWQKLREAEAELRNYASSNLPRPWSCHWDRSTKRFYYENRADSIYQWDRPREHPKTTKSTTGIIDETLIDLRPAGKRNSADNRVQVYGMLLSDVENMLSFFIQGDYTLQRSPISFIINHLMDSSHEMGINAAAKLITTSRKPHLLIFLEPLMIACTGPSTSAQKRPELNVSSTLACMNTACTAPVLLGIDLYIRSVRQLCDTLKLKISFRYSHKREKRRSHVKLVDYDVLDQHSWLESPPTIKSKDPKPPVDAVMSSHSSPNRSMSSPFNIHDTATHNKMDVFQDASGAKKAHLISQLAEFELACQQLEKELDFSRTTCTIIYDPVSSPRVVSLVQATSEDSDSMEQQETRFKASVPSFNAVSEGEGGNGTS